MDNNKEDNKEGVTFKDDESGIIVVSQKNRGKRSWFDGRLAAWLIRHSFGFITTPRQVQIFYIILIIVCFGLAFFYFKKAFSVPF